MSKYCFRVLLSIALLYGILNAQGGKLRGKVMDKKSGEPLIGANVTIEGTNYGASTDIDGEYIILNIPPGTYNVKAAFLGYSSIEVKNVKITSNTLVNLNIAIPSVPVKLFPNEIVEVRIPARDFLCKGKNPQIGYGAYGYLLFTRRPSGTDTTRYLRICKSFLSDLEPEDQYGSEDSSSLMVTYWLLDSITKPIHHLDDCIYLIQHYDYSRATIIASAIKKMKADGPILVAWRTPFQTRLTGDSALIFDLSRIADEDIDSAFGIWKDQIARDPSFWNNGFSIDKIRLAFHSLIQQYGQYIIDIVKGT